MSDSIVSNIKACYICGSIGNLHQHHVFYGSANRSKSDEDGCWVWLCPAHHNMSNNGVHFNKKLDNMIKEQTEKLWLEKYTSEECDWEERINEFIKRYGRNYL